MEKGWGRKLKCTERLCEKHVQPLLFLKVVRKIHGSTIWENLFSKEPALGLESHRAAGPDISACSNHDIKTADSESLIRF